MSFESLSGEALVKYPEEGCGKLFKCKTYLKNHLNNVNSKGIPFICLMCGEAIKHGTQKKSHMKKHQA